MLLRTWQVVVKELLHLRRDRVLTLFLFLFPTLQLVLVAQTAGAAVGNLPLAVWDQDHSALSRRVVQALDNTPELTLAYRPASMAEVRSLLDRGLAAVAVIIPPGFAADLLNPSGSPAVQVLVDGSNVSAGSAALAAAEGAVEDAVRRYLATAAALPYPAAAPADLRPLVRFNPELNGKFVAIPGLLAFVVYQVAIVVAAVTIVRERELGTLEQLAVSPVRGVEILTGKAIPAIGVAMLNFAVLLAVVTRVFHIPMRGSLPLLVGLTALFVTAEVGVGLMVSSLSRTQQQAVLLVFPLAMVDLALSGYLVPVESMPAGLRALSLFSPLRHYMRILKDIMLKAADLSTLWPSALALAALALVVGLLALRNVARNFE
ncbi:MAG: ABC transporter permease [Caldilineales bacterium]|nr:ABC transporter permease [Caldilineales bacterium]MDW8317757.1 ABC transporter permease [Anaerolineae bacterium]